MAAGISASIRPAGAPRPDAATLLQAFAGSDAAGRLEVLRDAATSRCVST